MWKWSPMWNEPNTSTPARLPVGERHPDLEVRRRHPDHLPAEPAQRALGGAALADDVERVGVRAQPGHVGVGVVADHRAVADRAEQAAVAEVGVEPALVDEVVEHPAGRLDQLQPGAPRPSGRRCAAAGRPCPGTAGGRRRRPAPAAARVVPKRTVPANSGSPPAWGTTVTSATPSSRSFSGVGQATRTPPTDLTAVVADRERPDPVGTEADVDRDLGLAVDGPGKVDAPVVDASRCAVSSRPLPRRPAPAGRPSRGRRPRCCVGNAKVMP